MAPDGVNGLPPLGRFLYWIRERHQVYLRRRAGLPRPWTDDPILQRVYFTNVCREWDKVTVHLRTLVRGPLADDPRVAFAVLAYRWFNLPATGELLHRAGLLTAWDEAAALDLLTAQVRAGRQVFTGAYNISNGGSTKAKINRVCEDYISPAWDAIMVDGPAGRMLNWMQFWAYKGGMTLTGLHGMLIKLPGMGGSGFMAAQVVADLKYTWVARNAPDWWTWCCLGPGSRRGLNLVLGRPVDGPAPPDALGHVNRLQQVVQERLPGVPRLHAQDLQNCLCEFSKFDKALQGGHVKRGYCGYP